MQALIYIYIFRTFILYTLLLLCTILVPNFMEICEKKNKKTWDEIKIRNK